MLRLAVDENINIAIVRGLVRRYPALDIVRVQDAGLEGADDPDILAWAADAGRVLLTHDAETMPDAAYERIAAGGAVPGLFVIPWRAPLGAAIEDLALLIEGSLSGEWQDQVVYIPLRSPAKRKRR